MTKRKSMTEDMREKPVRRKPRAKAGIVPGDTRPTMPGRCGGTLLRGPTNRGGTGRPRVDFLAWCRSTLERPGFTAKIQQVLDDPDHPAYASMVKLISERAHGKPHQSVSTEATGELTVRIVHE